MTSVHLTDFIDIPVDIFAEMCTAWDNNDDIFITMGYEYDYEPGPALVYISTPEGENTQLPVSKWRKTMKQFMEGEDSLRKP